MESLFQGYFSIFGIEAAQVLYHWEFTVVQNKQILFSLHFGPCHFLNGVVVAFLIICISVRFLEL